MMNFLRKFFKNFFSIDYRELFSVLNEMNWETLFLWLKYHHHHQFKFITWMFLCLLKWFTFISCFINKQTKKNVFCFFFFFKNTIYNFLFILQSHLIDRQSIIIYLVLFAFLSCGLQKKKQKFNNGFNHFTWTFRIFHPWTCIGHWRER